MGKHYKPRKNQRIFYILDKDCETVLKTLTASQLAELLGIKREYLDIYLAKNSTFRGYPIAEE